LNNLDLDFKIIEFAENFDKFRAYLRAESTRPIDNSSYHEKNQKLFDDFFKKEIESAVYNPRTTFNQLFQHYWKKIYYAGFKAENASLYIKSIDEFQIFSDYKKLCGENWFFSKDEHKKYKNSKKESNSSKNLSFSALKELYFKNSGDEIVQLMTGLHPYYSQGLKFLKNPDKVDKIIKIAKKLNDISNDFGIKYPFEYFVGKDFIDTNISNVDEPRFWEILKRFNFIFNEKETNTITSLHLMMDLGFPCVKPDKVLTGIFYDLGFLDELGRDGSYILKKYASEEKIYKKVIQIGLKLSKMIKPLHGNNVLRELDLYVVKFGQEPERHLGITKNLKKELESGRTIVDVIQNIGNKNKLKSLYN